MAVLRPDQSGSFWYLPSRTSQNHLSEQQRQLFFRTTTDSFYKGVQAPEESRGENFIALHNVGQRDTKYLPYQINRAPLVDRTACAYTNDYVELPLGDCAFLRDMASVFKNRTAAAGKAGSKAKFNGKTRYNEDFKKLSTEDAYAARQDSTKVDAGLTNTIPTAGDSFLEKRSVEQSAFQTPDEQAWCKARKAEKPKTTLAIGQLSYPTKTSYASQFESSGALASNNNKSRRGLPRCSSAPTMRRRPTESESQAVAAAAARKLRPVSAGAVLTQKKEASAAPRGQACPAGREEKKDRRPESAPVRRR